MDERGLYDIYGTWHIPFWQTSWFFWLSITIGALVGAFFARILYRRYFNKNQELTPYESAQRGLKKLQNKLITNKADAQAVYFELTGLLKQYIQNSLGYQVIGLTDSELISFLSEHYFPAQAYAHLKDICNGCQHIKFAQENVLNEQIQQDIAKSFVIIDKVHEHLQLRNK
jgi:hypothetical protein